MKKPKIKYETRCAVPKSLEPVECPIDVKFIPKEGSYYILKGKEWLKYAFKNKNWYFLYIDNSREIGLDFWKPLPNLREIEWDALKSVGYDKLNKEWQKNVFAKSLEDSRKETRRFHLKRKLQNSKSK